MDGRSDAGILEPNEFFFYPRQIDRVETEIRPAVDKICVTGAQKQYQKLRLLVWIR